MDKLEERIYNCINNAYGALFERGQYKGHWDDVRPTALIGICLSFREEEFYHHSDNPRFRRPKNPVWIDSLSDWLLQRQIEIDDDTASWGEEIWDTSWALMSLHRAGVAPTNEKIIKGFSYFFKTYNLSGYNNWCYSPWETSWAVLAILEYNPDEISKIEECLSGNNVESKGLFGIAEEAARWLASLQDKKGDNHGRVVSPHYTGYFVQICYLLNRKNGSDPDPWLEEAMKKASAYLLNNVSDEKLWTGEAWSNGQILWSLARSEMLPVDDYELMLKIIAWFENNQDDRGIWADPGNTASVIIGLYYLLRSIKIKDGVDPVVAEESIRDNFRRFQLTPPLRLETRLIEKHPDGTLSLNTTKRGRWAAVGCGSVITAITTLGEFFILIGDYVVSLIYVFIGFLI